MTSGPHTNQIPRPHIGNHHRLGILMVLLLAHLSTAAIYLTQPASPPPPPAATILRLDPNTATHAELTLLPRIGPKLAQYIIDYRNNATPQPAFRSPADLDAVPRIGPRTIARLQPLLKFDQAHDEHPSPRGAP